MTNNFKLIVASLLLMPSLVLAQGQGTLPKPGLTPASPFYFLDKLSESIQDFFAFRPESKAKLQVKFAIERLAEIKDLLEKEGIGAKGLVVARERLQTNMNRAADILDKEKSAGQDVSGLAKELTDELEADNGVLTSIFKEQKQALKIKFEELKDKIRQARQVGDVAKIDLLSQELTSLKAQREMLRGEEDDHDKVFGQEGDKLERSLEAQVEAEKAISQAEIKKQELLYEITLDLLQVPSDVFTKFDNMLSQAKELMTRQNYQGAKQLAKQAEKSLDNVSEAMGGVREAQDKIEELKEEEVERVREFEKLSNEEEREALKQAGEGLREQAKEAEEEAKQATERLREAAEQESELEDD